MLLARIVLKFLLSVSLGFTYDAKLCTLRCPVTDMIPRLDTPAAWRVEATSALRQWLVYLRLRLASSEIRAIKEFNVFTPTGTLAYHTGSVFCTFNRGFWNNVSQYGFSVFQISFKGLYWAVRVTLLLIHTRLLLLLPGIYSMVGFISFIV